MKNKILIIDDDVDMCTLLERYLSSKGFEVEKAFTGASGLSKFKKGSYDLVLCDFRLPDRDGIEMIKSIKAIDHTTQVIVITGYSDVKLAIQSVRSGAFEYVTKPIQPEEILSTIKEAIEGCPEDESSPDIAQKQKITRKRPGLKISQEYVKGNSADSKKLQESVELIAPTDMSVIILGETGTGKEVAARTIHKNSKRAGKAFVAVDCGALPKELASSELFGHVKGAFTGAVNDKTGSFELADGGTLFLDEIGNLSYENQIKLLRVIQERQFKKVGGAKDITVDVRIIVATNENLLEAISNGDFREDLYYRLNEYKIELLPLRNRAEDLMIFAEHFMKQANLQLERSVTSFSSEVIDKLKAYPWHGNLRELKNVVKRAVLLTKGDTIGLTALPQEIIHPTSIDNGSVSIDTGFITDLKSVTEEAERRAIESVLRRTNYNKTKTAEILQIDRKTLYNKISAYGIEG